MKQLKDYIIPTIIITIISLLVCLGLWIIFVSTQSTIIVDATVTDIVEVSEAELPDLGILIPIITFVGSGIKVMLFMIIPGILTHQVLKRLNRNKEMLKINKMTP